MKQISKIDIKQALYHEEFRNLFPELKNEIDQFLKKTCLSCNGTLYEKILKYPDRLKKYFPTKEVDKTEKWQVINCHINELEKNLKRLPTGQKYISMARYEDQITVIINFVDYF